MIFFSSNYLTSLNYNNPFPSVLCNALEHNLVETQCHLFFHCIQLPLTSMGNERNNFAKNGSCKHYSSWFFFC